MTPQRFAVFAIREAQGKTTWIRAGSAWRNRDGSLNVFLEVLPIDGRLHIREPLPNDSPTSPQSQADGSSPSEE